MNIIKMVGFAVDHERKCLHDQERKLLKTCVEYPQFIPMIRMILYKQSGYYRLVHLVGSDFADTYWNSQVQMALAIVNNLLDDLVVSAKLCGSRRWNKYYNEYGGTDRVYTQNPKKIMLLVRRDCMYRRLAKRHTRRRIGAQ